MSPTLFVRPPGRRLIVQATDGRRFIFGGGIRNEELRDLIDALEAAISTNGDVTAGGALRSNNGNVYLGDHTRIQENGSTGQTVFYADVGGATTACFRIDDSGRFIIDLEDVRIGGIGGEQPWRESNQPPHLEGTPVTSAVVRQDDLLHTILSDEDKRGTLLSSTTPYVASGGNHLKPIIVTAAGEHIDFSIFGNWFQTEVVNGSGGTIYLHAGLWRSWSGQGSNKRLAVPAGATVSVRGNGSVLYPSSPATLSYDATAFPACSILLGFIGQSLSSYLAKHCGLFGMQRELREELGLSSTSIYPVDATVGNTELSQWWNSGPGTPTAYTTAFITNLNAAIAAGQTGEIVIWCDLGQADLSPLSAGTFTQEQYRDARAAWRAYIRANVTGTPDIHWIDVPVGSYGSNAFPQWVFDSSRQVIHQAARDEALTFIGPDTYFMPRADAVHLTAMTGTIWEGQLGARVIANALGLSGSPFTVQPYVSSISVSGNTVTGTITTPSTLHRPGAGTVPGLPPKDFITMREPGDPRTATYATLSSFSWTSATAFSAVFDEDVDALGYEPVIITGNMNHIAEGRYVHANYVGVQSYSEDMA